MPCEIIRGMPEALYRKAPGISQSQDKYYRANTPAHALAEIKKHAVAEDDDEKDHLINGTCLHALILEEKTIFEEDIGRKTKKNPKQPEGDIYLLSPHNAAIVRGMAAGIRRNPEIMEMIDSRFETEVSIFWDDKEFGRLKARIDYMWPRGIGDLKTTRTGADLRSFKKAMQEFGYAVQASHYFDAAIEAEYFSTFPNSCDDFFFAVVENFEPYEANKIKISHEAIQAGAHELRKLREIRYACEKLQKWPGYLYDPQGVSLPKWRMDQEEF